MGVVRFTFSLRSLFTFCRHSSQFADSGRCRSAFRDDGKNIRLAAVLCGRPPPAERKPQHVVPDFRSLQDQLQRHQHLTLQLAWEEYRQANPEGYRYSWFCKLYQRWRRKQDVVLRQENKAGEKGFVDWAGATLPVHEPITGAIWQASLFVMVLAASSYT